MTTTPLKPPKLMPGDTIGIVAPCLPVLPSFRDKYEHGKHLLEHMGFRLKEGKTIRLQHGYAAGTPQEQADDIQAMFADSEVRAIIAAVGGHTAITVLDLIDYDLIRANPKPFIGMSDVTSYHLALYARAGLVGFHMDEVSFGLGANWDNAETSDYAIKQAYVDILTKTKAIGNLPHLTSWETWRGGEAMGRLIGGNLNALCKLIGTPFLPSLEQFKGAILFWEQVGRPTHETMQMLYQLKHAGILERISGMCVGTITKVPPHPDKDIAEPSLKQIVLDITEPYDTPIIASMDFGHHTPNIPMPIGLQAHLNAVEQQLTLTESAVV